MKDAIAQLYQRLSVDIDAEPLAARVKGAQSALRALTPELATGLVLVAHRGKVTEANSEWLRGQMEAAGAELPKAHKQELAALASAVLIEAWSAGVGFASTAGGLALRSATFLGWTPHAQNLRSSASSYLVTAGTSVRRSQVVKVQPPLKGKPEEVIPDAAGFDPTQLRGLFSEVQSLRSSLNAVQRHLGTAQSVASEQSSILWWLFGARFADGPAWAEVSEACRPLRVASDLALFTAFVPGPVGAPRYFEHALRMSGADPDRKLTVAGSVRTLDSDTRTDLRGRTSVDGVVEFLPILSSIHGMPYPGASRPGNLQRTSLGLAEQLYNELLLVRALQEDG